MCAGYLHVTDIDYQWNKNEFLSKNPGRKFVDLNRTIKTGFYSVITDTGFFRRNKCFRFLQILPKPTGQHRVCRHVQNAV